MQYFAVTYIAVNPGFVGFLSGHFNLSAVGEKEVDLLNEAEMRGRERKKKKTLPTPDIFSLNSLGYHSFPSVNPFCD